MLGEDAFHHASFFWWACHWLSIVYGGTTLLGNNGIAKVIAVTIDGEKGEALGDEPVKNYGKWPFTQVYGIQLSF